MPKFYHYNGGKIIENWQINQWLGEVRDKLLSGKMRATVSSGDCSVIGVEWPTEYEIFVCNSSGRSVIRFNKGYDLDEMRNHFFQYERPLTEHELVVE
jgi:hypothetical protein